MAKVKRENDYLVSNSRNNFNSGKCAINERLLS